MSVINNSQSSDRFEGCGKDGPIRCIFLCEFHHVAGPKITCQVCLFILFQGNSSY